VAGAALRALLFDLADVLAALRFGDATGAFRGVGASTETGGSADWAKAAPTEAPLTTIKDPATSVRRGTATCFLIVGLKI
jgi:hypothetical protein